MTRQQWLHTSAWVGVAGLVVSMIDPMEGAFIALPFGAVLASSAFFSASRYRVALLWSFGSMAVGVAVLLGLTAIGGIGGNSGHSPWWGLLLIPYPAGWLASLVCGVLLLREPPHSIREKPV